MTRPGAFDPGEAPPEPEQIPEPKDTGPVETFQQKALRRAQEEEMRLKESQTFDMAGWRVRWNVNGQVEDTLDGGQTWQVFSMIGQSWFVTLADGDPGDEA